MATFTVTDHTGATTTIEAEAFDVVRGGYHFVDSAGVVVAAFNQTSVQRILRTPEVQFPYVDLRPLLASVQRDVELLSSVAIGVTRQQTDEEIAIAAAFVEERTAR